MRSPSPSSVGFCMHLVELPEIHELLRRKLRIFFDEAAEKDDAAFGIPVVDDAG